jgi:hypothetical protein
MHVPVDFSTMQFSMDPGLIDNVAVWIVTVGLCPGVYGSWYVPIFYTEVSLIDQLSREKVRDLIWREGMLAGMEDQSQAQWYIH